MDFAALPPEINSARMYAGPGATPMMAAAATWNALGAELATTASSCESVISTLAGEQWRGPASAAMTTAVAPYLAWISTTAAAAEHAATQATASAAAFEAAFAMTVPPPVIAANRALLATLVATNFLGMNAEAIAATEALYGEMWTQDAAAMYSYAGASASAGVLEPLTSPTPTSDPAGQTGLSQLVDGLSTAVQELAAPLPAAGSASGTLGSIGSSIGAALDSVDGFLGIPSVTNTINGTVNTAAWFGMNAVPTFVSLLHTLAANGSATLTGTVDSSGLGGALLASSVTPVSAPGSGGAPVTASVGRAGPIGGLSVPAAWSAAVPASTAPTASGGTGWAPAAEEAAALEAVPAGMPSPAAAGRGYGLGAPRYGFKPTVMGRPTGVG